MTITKSPSMYHLNCITNSVTFLYRLIHVTDWLPTLYSAAGGVVKDLGPIDGIDQWNNIKVQGPSKRTEMLYNSNPHGTQRSPTGSAIRYPSLYRVQCGMNIPTLPQVRRHETNCGRARPRLYCAAWRTFR